MFSVKSCIERKKGRGFYINKISCLYIRWNKYIYIHDSEKGKEEKETNVKSAAKKPELVTSR